MSVRSEAVKRRRVKIILEFYRRPMEAQVCPICGDNCSGRKKMAADHAHQAQYFRDMICQECNVTLGHSRERDDLLGDGKLGQYLRKHKENYAAR